MVMPVAHPLVILAPSRSYTSVVCAMLGQHPQMYDLPELHLFTSDMIWQWWAFFGRTIYGHGLLRAVAELNWGAQTEETIELARWFLKRWFYRETGDLFTALAQHVYPLIPVEKSPATAYRVENMQRARYFFPRTKFLHLLRHPLGQGQSLVGALSAFLPFEDFAKVAYRLRGLFDFSTDPPTFDPQIEWHQSHVRILTFLRTVPREQQKRVRGEDLLADPDRHLREIAAWMGLRADLEAIAAMKHPEQSPFACIGPRNAPLGGDPNFLREPRLRAGTAEVQSLEGPLPWRKDGAGFSPQVRALARRFGYS
jgi:hypothetical protein